MNDPDLRIVNSGTDADFAQKIKERLNEKLTELCAICDEADKRGFMVAYNTSKGPIGKQIITQIMVAKIY